MVNKIENSLNDCQENWHNNNFFVFLRAIYSARVCQNAEPNENSSSKIEEVPEGRRSMTTTK